MSAPTRRREQLRRQPGSRTSLRNLLWAVAAAATAPVASATALDCKKVVVDGQTFDFGKLAGPHTVVTTESKPPSYYNTTYTLDICAPLKRKDKAEKDFECPEGSRVCAIIHHWNADKKADEIEQVIPIAGGSAGGDYESWEAKRLQPTGGEGGSSDSQDKDKGVQITLKGAALYQQREQLAVVDFRCNPKLDGTEGEWESEDEYVKPSADEGGDDKKPPAGGGEPEKQRKKDGAALIWDGYKRSADDKTDTLYLTWYSKYACEAKVEGPGQESSHWGLFTWLVVL
ncbi:autophagy-related protein 27 [Lasiosphaeria miniovina]|uniref:Autophagy-related protein 27 n=1 Tax=Lasiosphaeria miniovina TaxID=1954250 RepID=A0AA39ZZZ7_9PEZI|nr:autophagy-related protein 27 [Lasiosphaeria miniovina]KAK0706766.1 autophagy-related protein 27 [Lasiosphaeria miniovina]